MSETQTYKNHARFDPLWHFVAAPFFLLNFILSIVLTVHQWPHHSILFLWWNLFSLILFIYIGAARGETLKVQDRIIRLEERLRYQALLPSEDLARSNDLTLRQIIGLRFASDAELPALIRRALDEKLTEKQIKQAVVNWRADLHRA